MDHPSCLRDESFDLLVIGGGISGAGVLLEAARRGLKAALIEQRDFAWGTSSRSSKLVHGGLRYLKEGKLKLTRESVLERERLHREAPELVQRQTFVLTHYLARKPGRATMLAGLTLYDLLAGIRSRRFYRAAELACVTPYIGQNGLQGGSGYLDAKTDDARLVWRVLMEARQHGGIACNYLAAEQLLKEDGKLVGVQARSESGECFPIRAKVVVSATGVWADRLRGEVGGKPMLRPLRGSHLMIPRWRLPVAASVSFLHPADGRPVFVYPWEGLTLVGTTDVDHHGSLDEEAAISADEFAYLLAALHDQFPDLQLGYDDVVATYSGVRPVVDEGQGNASQASRDHVVLTEQGLITVTGGKLTTFRLMALDALQLAAQQLGRSLHLEARPVLSPPTPLPSDWPQWQRQRLQARYGFRAEELCADSTADERICIPGTDTLWLELRLAARHEQIVHLDDLLLRRVRLGLLLPEGGLQHAERIRQICQPELGWSDAQWQSEVERYRQLWRKHYGKPAREAVSAALR